MIKFFRKIRQNLLMENKTGKYFKYAIGEIVLVVIGILIALQINTWKENQKNNNKKTVLLKALKLEYSSNLKQIDTVLYYDNIVLNNVQRLMKLGPNTPLEKIKDSLPHWVQNTAFRWTFDPVNGALRSGISSGEIHLIKNDSLTTLLFEWPDLVNDFKEGEARTVDAVIESKSVVEKHIRLIDYKSTFANFLGKSKFTSNYKSLFNDPLYEDYLGERYLSMEDALKDLIQVKMKNELILDLIDKELNMN